jgi:hypothetical protein
MLLFQKRFHAGLRAGTITLTLRAWKTLRVKVGGRYRVHPIGVVEVDAIRWVSWADVTDADALRGGFTSRSELQAYVSQVVPKLNDETKLAAIDLHHAGDGDRVAGAMTGRLKADDVETLRATLNRFDAQTPWSFEVLRLIEKRPKVAASQLAQSRGEETAPFKARVVKLKRLGLTQSFEVGYSLTPRGTAFLKAATQRRKKPT